MASYESGPAVGWFVLSEADRAAAARYLDELASDGTRDELGFAPIHFAYADRFFPGTSVQHDCLRYVFFAAWTYEEIFQATAGQAFPPEAVEDIEERYSRRLMKTVPALQNSGIAGWMKYRDGQRPVVPASRIYWGALKTWNILNSISRTGEPPNRSDLHRLWPSLVSYEEGGDGKKLTQTKLFDGLPDPPADWNRKRGSLSFSLSADEVRYIRRKWRCLKSCDGEPPLLSKLAEAGVAPISLWSPDIASLANKSERASLTLARRAASLVCIGRAAYAALVEQRRNRDLDVDASLHAEALKRLIDKHRSQALRLDVDKLTKDASLDNDLREFLKHIQNWTNQNGELGEIEQTIATRECSLKQSRSYLLNEKRRQYWSKEEAEPLDYRWPKVRGLINDVLEVA